MSRELPYFYVFEVQASEPNQPGGGHPVYANLTTFVVAPSLERALQLTREQHPEMRTHQVIRRNQSRSLIIDPVIQVTMEDDQ